MELCYWNDDVYSSSRATHHLKTNGVKFFFISFSILNTFGFLTKYLLVTEIMKKYLDIPVYATTEVHSFYISCSILLHLSRNGKGHYSSDAISWEIFGICREYCAGRFQTLSGEKV
jgi:hypothetical protein